MSLVQRSEALVQRLISRWLNRPPHFSCSSSTSYCVRFRLDAVKPIVPRRACARSTAPECVRTKSDEANLARVARCDEDDDEESDLFTNRRERPLLAASTFPPSTPLLTLLHPPPHEHLLARHVREHQHPNPGFTSAILISHSLHAPHGRSGLSPARSAPPSADTTPRRQPRRDRRHPRPTVRRRDVHERRDARRWDRLRRLRRLRALRSAADVRRSEGEDRDAEHVRSASAGFAASALPMAFRSEHKEPVGMDTFKVHTTMKLERLVHGGGVQIAIRVGVTHRPASACRWTRARRGLSPGATKTTRVRARRARVPRRRPCALSSPPLFARPPRRPRARARGRWASPPRGGGQRGFSISSAATGGVALAAPTAECPRPENTVRLRAKNLSCHMCSR